MSRPPLAGSDGNLPPDERVSPLARLERAADQWNEECAVATITEYLRDLRVPRPEDGEGGYTVADLQTLRSVGLGARVMLHHRSFGSFCAVALDEFFVDGADGEVWVVTDEHDFTDNSLAIVEVAWYNVSDVTPYDDLPDGWKRLIARWTQLLASESERMTRREPLPSGRWW